MPAYVERFGPWPSDYAGARMVTVAQRTEQTQQQKPNGAIDRDVAATTHEPVSLYTPTPSVPGTLIAHATLSVNQMQDLDEQIAALTKACVDYFGVEPSFSLQIEVHPKSAVQAEHIEKVNQILKEGFASFKVGVKNCMGSKKLFLNALLVVHAVHLPLVLLLAGFARILAKCTILTF